MFDNIVMPKKVDLEIPDEIVAVLASSSMNNTYNGRGQVFEVNQNKRQTSTFTSNQTRMKQLPLLPNIQSKNTPQLSPNVGVRSSAQITPHNYTINEREDEMEEMQSYKTGSSRMFGVQTPSGMTTTHKEDDGTMSMISVDSMGSSIAKNNRSKLPVYLINLASSKARYADFASD